MKEIFEQVIKRGGYDLATLLTNIDRYHVEGKLTDGDRTELYALARAGAAPQYDMRVEIEALWAAVRALQAASSSAGGETEWPEYVQPTGAHDAYQTGDKVIFNGTKYICKTDNCVWAPNVYPQAWEKSE